MAEQDNHTLRLLREFREEFRGFRNDFAEFRARVDERFEDLLRLFAGETVLGRYAAADVERRLDAIEKRIAALEETR